jgi:hypothetical protein
MKKKHTNTSLIVLFILVLCASPLIFTDAAGSSSGGVSPIDGEVWEAIQASPGRETTFIVQLRAEVGPEMAIDAQFRLEPLLDILGEKGDLRNYQSFYGDNIIKITAGPGVLRFLEDWPELERVSLYQPGEVWELCAESTQDMSGLDATGQITGTVTASSGGAALSGIRVTAYWQSGPTTWNNVGNVLTDASGTYAISGLVEGIYRAKFEDLTGNYVSEYYNDQPTFTQATNFNVYEGSSTSNINAGLARAGKISGTLTLVEGGGPASDVIASAWNFSGGSWQMMSNALSSTSGAYSIGGLPADSYRVKFTDIYTPPRYLTEWYDNVLSVDLAQDIPVAAGATVTNINASLGAYGSIKGTIKAYDGTTNLAGINVDVYRYDSTYAYWEWFAGTTSDGSGNYQIYGLVTEDYRVQFSDPQDQFVGEFYNDKADLTTADNVAVSLGYETTGINALLALKPTTVTSSLVSGWNLISVKVALSDGSLPTAFDSIAGKYGDVFAYDACDATDHWKLFDPTRPPELNDLTAVNTVQGYWVKMNSAGTLTHTGTYPLQTSIALCPGWNLVGYPSAISRPVGTALAGISGKYNLVWQYRAADTADPWKSFNPSLPPDLNDLKDMEPGYGYWIYMTQAATLTISGR